MSSERLFRKQFALIQSAMKNRCDEYRADSNLKMLFQFSIIKMIKINKVIEKFKRLINQLMKKEL